MKSINKINSINSQRQKGAALLIAMVVLASVAVFYLIGQFGSVNQKLDRQDNRIAVLAEAKKGLIAYAVSYIDSNHGEMGFLPCPDSSGPGLGEGIQDGICGGRDENAIGRLPWYSLDLPPLKDDSNECLWYAVSGYFKSTPKTLMLNEDSNGLFEVYDAQGNLLHGTSPENRVVAIIFSPGPPLQGQSRTGGVANTEQCGGNFTASNYLEDDGGLIDNSTVSITPDTVDMFIRAGTDSDAGANPFNDRLVVITQSEIWNAVKKRRTFQSNVEQLTDKIASCVVEYGNLETDNYLPWPAALNLGIAGTDYRDELNYNDEVSPVSLLGRLPKNVQNSKDEIAANAGTVPTPACKNCLDKCQTDYDKDLVAAQEDYDKDLVDAQADYDDDLANALEDYNKDLDQALKKFDKCKKDPVVCQAEYDSKAADALADYNQEKSDALVDYNEEKADALDDYNKDLADALNDFNKCKDKCLNKGFCAGYIPGAGGTPKTRVDLFAACSLWTPDDDTLWQHWKDHFFYVVSGSYAPDSTDLNCAGGNCVSVGGADYAGLVIYSGERLAGINRNAPPPLSDPDDKATISNYLEGNNATNYQDINGTGVYEPNLGGAGNDYMVCISTGANLTSAACP